MTTKNMLFTFVFSLLTNIIFSYNLKFGNLSSTLTSTKSNLKDTTAPSIKSGFYLVINDTENVAFRKLYSITKGDFSNGKIFILSLDDYLSFDNIDSIYIQYSKETKYYDIYFRFTKDGQKKFYNLTNKANDVKYLSDNGRPKLATVINNTLVQVVTIIGPFSGDTITLYGIFDERTAADLKNQIADEIKYQKN